MPTYIYETVVETVSESCCSDPTYCEIEQSEHEQPLIQHPDTGAAIKRVIIDGKPLVKEEEDGSSCCSGSGCC
jgi:hypothetical protein